MGRGRRPKEHMEIARDVAVIELANGATGAEAAKVAGVSRETVRVWSAEDTERVEREKERYLRDARARMQDALPSVVANLAAVAVSDDRDRVPAAKELLARVMGTAEIDETTIARRVQQEVGKIEFSLAQIFERHPAAKADFLDFVSKYRG